MSSFKVYVTATLDETIPLEDVQEALAKVVRDGLVTDGEITGVTAALTVGDQNGIRTSLDARTAIMTLLSRARQAGYITSGDVTDVEEVTEDPTEEITLTERERELIRAFRAE